MRLIDADLLLAVARDMQSETEETAYNFLNAAQNPSTEWECVEDLIENATTIEAEPVRYAHWINDTFCSNCKRFPVDVSVSISNQELTKYFSRCPHYGAKMGGKDDIMEKDKLAAVLEAHKHWVNEDRPNWGEMRANLQGAYLKGAYLCHADLRGADLRGANLLGAYLKGADLCCAYLKGADLCNANLRGAKLRGANLCNAYLQGADLRDAHLQGAYLCNAHLQGADLQGADLQGADLQGADLQGANLQGADLQGAKDVPYLPMICPEEGGFFGYKKCAGDKILRLYIPKDAKRSSATGRKCRCSKAFVCEIVDSLGNKCDFAVSEYDGDFVYNLHEWVETEFCEERFNECAEGIHFFLNRKEAEIYVL